MSALFGFAFRGLIKTGNLRVTDCRGKSCMLGDGTGPLSAIRFTNRWSEIKAILDPYLAVGEGYTDGRMVVEEGGLFHFLEIVCRNHEERPLPGWTRLSMVVRWLIRRIDQFNPAERARRNVAAHYDINPEIYKMFLDEDFQYSCAYFENDDDDLETAQLAKKRHLAAKLSIKPDHRILDIGSGWGGLALYLARVTDATVTGITLSEEQLKIARERAKSAPAGDKVSFRFEDYRETSDRFDRIVSVGMFEHVGVDHYRAFFKRIHDLLADDGVALIHSIGRMDYPQPTNPFIKKHIFPGGALPSLSEIFPIVEKLGLKVTDVEILRVHYAKTLRHWRERFMARRDDAEKLMGERFCRMWEFYLAGSEVAFLYQHLMVFQIQMAKDLYALPLTRNYIYEDEKRLKQSERFGRDRPKEATGAPREKTGDTRRRN